MKWTSKWFRALSDKHKVFYLYVLDNCDNAGVISYDLDLIGYTLNNTYTKKELQSAFDGKAVFVGEDKLVVKNYIAFQNGDVFDSKSRISASIRSTLNSHGLLNRYKKGDFGTTNEAVSMH